MSVIPYVKGPTSMPLIVLGVQLSCVLSPESSTRHFFRILVLDLLDEVYRSWQNIDACDASFMTPKRLNVLKILVNHPDISMFTLNTPQSSMSGVIPLGMAAWLNQPQAIRVLLEESADSVSVDGMDSHGATALMCE